MNKEKSNEYVAIMAGGIGSRFWPYSRTSKPKQFLDVLGIGKSLIQLTYERFLNICPKENIFIVTNADYTDLVKQQLPEIHDDQILQEPLRRNTAPCIAYACQKIAKLNPKANIIVSPSDHLVSQEVAFVKTVKQALAFTNKNDVLLTLGIKPTRPDTGYGYIQREENAINSNVFEVKAFTEKPNLDLAKTFIKSGDFLWNSGMFIWRAEVINASIKKHLPEIDEAISAQKESFFTENEAEAMAEAYAQCTSISIDFGLLEKADNVAVLPASFGWSDIGTWGSLYSIYEKDYLGNAVNGDKVKILDGSDNMIMAPKNKMVVISGLKDFCVIDTKDVLMILPKKKEQEVKKITNDLKNERLDKYL